MKQIELLRAALFLSLAGAVVAVAQSVGKKIAAPDTRPAGLEDKKKACAFNILGVWKSDATSETNPVFYSFDPTGWITVLVHTAEALPQDFEMTVQAQYRLDDPNSPTRIEFIAKGKNEAFASGRSSFEIIQYSDDSLTIADLKTGYRTRWDRIQSRRYFLIFAAGGGEALPGPVYGAWISMDGRKVETEVIGVHLKNSGASSAVPIFDLVPPDVFSEIASNPASEAQDDASKGGQNKVAEAKNTNSSVVMRLELTESDFLRSHKVYELWVKYVSEKVLPNTDPYINAMEFLTNAAESVNQCGEKIKLHKLHASKPEHIIAETKIPLRPLAYIRLMRKKNKELHIPNGMFPWNWRPNIGLSH